MRKLSEIVLSEKSECHCGESITVTASEVLHFDSIECPKCGSDVYHEEWLYEEALNIAEDLTDYSELNQHYHMS